MKKILIFVLITVFGLSGCDISYNNSDARNYQEKTPIVSEDNSGKGALDASNSSSENTKTTMVGNTSSNIYNYGVVATDGEWEYFWAGATHGMDEFNGGKLCKMKIDGSDFQVLSDDRPYYINVVGDWVYYIKQENEEASLGYGYGKIYRIRKDGTDRKELYSYDSSNMIVVGEWIYFTNESDGKKIYRIKVDGSEATPLNNSESFALQYADGWLYYEVKESEDVYYFYKMSIEQDSKPIHVNFPVGDFIVNNGWIYYSNNEDQDTLYRARVDGTDNIKLFDEPFSSFSVTKDSVYCFSLEAIFYRDTGGHSNELYKIDIDGNQVIKIPNENDPLPIHRSHFGGIVGSYIYYWDFHGEWFELARMKNDGTSDEILIDKLKEVR
ncbi:DUF5050 domain-containing protein [Wukongibacter baidiensis]|uniref:DUF5050 domain-containing protein n=1 Tax=Wukongibacter baidiensis TaxID=1723361 RepID=UPI003D7FF9DA